MAEEFLVAQDIYLKSGIHIGTKFRTKHMNKFIYKTRSDGLSVLNLQEIDNRLKLASTLLSKYKPDEILIVCRRETGWKPLRLLGEMTGIKVFAGRYPPGILTNKELDTYMEIKLILVVDAWPDRNAILDAIAVGVPVIALCDTNNQSNFIDLVVPANNKGKKALGLVFYILTREYLKRTGQISKDKEFKKTVEDFAEE
jgi:small subunit ribosomal protein S2